MTSATKTARKTTVKVKPQPAPHKQVGRDEKEQRPIWVIAAELAAQMPEAELDKIPHDGSINYKHYLHGYPKVEP